MRSRRAGGVNEVLRVGLVGFGAVARVHWRAYQGLRTIQVVAIADIDPRKAATASKECRVKAYGSVEEMLREEALDITCVLTPPAAHEQIVSVCAEAGVHVLCEKPLSLSVESCERMIRICRENEVRLCYGASYRYMPAMLAAREKIARGDIGEVLILRESAVGGSGVKHRGTLDYGHYPKGGPGGSRMGLCDHGVHLVDALSWLTNLGVTRVWGRGNISGERQLREFLRWSTRTGQLRSSYTKTAHFPQTFLSKGFLVGQVGGIWGKTIRIAKAGAGKHILDAFTYTGTKVRYGSSTTRIRCSGTTTRGSDKYVSRTNRFRRISRSSWMHSLVPFGSTGRLRCLVRSACRRGGYCRMSIRQPHEGQ